MAIRDFQRMIHERYYATDSARGAAKTFLWFAEEVGELARIMARKYGDQSFKKNESADQLADEVADVLWVLICIANQTGVDLTDALKKNIEKKTLRDKDRHQQNDKLK